MLGTRAGDRGPGPKRRQAYSGPGGGTTGVSRCTSRCASRVSRPAHERRERRGRRNGDGAGASRSALPAHVARLQSARKGDRLARVTDGGKYAMAGHSFEGHPDQVGALYGLRCAGLAAVVRHQRPGGRQRYGQNALVPARKNRRVRWGSLLNGSHRQIQG